MSKDWDKRLGRMIETEVEQIPWESHQEQQALAGIHKQLHERSHIMRFSKKGKMIAVAAAIAVTGTITAIAAGRVAYLTTSTYRNEAIVSVAELEKAGEEALGADVTILEQLSDGSTFTEGYVIDVVGHDEAGNQVGTFPEISAHYGDIFMDISTGSEKLESGGEETYDYQEEYKGIQISARADNYLFLPPDAKPSAEDAKLEEEGKLYISYGSSEEERMVYKHVIWKEDGVRYMLMTNAEKSLDEMVDRKSVV